MTEVQLDSGLPSVFSATVVQNSLRCCDGVALCLLCFVELIGSDLENLLIFAEVDLLARTITDKGDLYRLM